MIPALVVDDSRAMRLLIGKILAELGFRVREAGNGREALVLLMEATETPLLVMIDWNMPEINGYQLVELLRADPRYNDTRIVMVTTQTEMAQVVRALDAGANEYIMKPFTKDVVREKLELLSLSAL